MGLFSKSKNKKDPTKVVAECLTTVRKEKRQVERQILTLQREEEKAAQVIRQAAKSGSTDACRNIALAIANSRKLTRRLQTVKFRLDSVEINLQQQRSAIRQTGEVETSAEVMADMSELVRAPELSKSVQKMAKQLQKLGLVDSELHSATDAVADDDVVANDADDVLNDILASSATTGTGRRSLAPSRSLSVDVPSRRTTTARPAAAAVAAGNAAAAGPSEHSASRSVSVVDRVTSVSISSSSSSSTAAAAAASSRRRPAEPLLA